MSGEGHGIGRRALHRAHPAAPQRGQHEEVVEPDADVRAFVADERRVAEQRGVRPRRRDREEPLVGRKRPHEGAPVGERKEVGEAAALAVAAAGGAAAAGRAAAPAAAAARRRRASGDSAPTSATSVVPAPATSSPTRSAILRDIRASASSASWSGAGPSRASSSASAARSDSRSSGSTSSARRISARRPSIRSPWTSQSQIRAGSVISFAQTCGAQAAYGSAHARNACSHQNCSSSQAPIRRASASTTAGGGRRSGPASSRQSAAAPYSRNRSAPARSRDRSRAARAQRRRGRVVVNGVVAGLRGQVLLPVHAAAPRRAPGPDPADAATGAPPRRRRRRTTGRRRTARRPARPPRGCRARRRWSPSRRAAGTPPRARASASCDSAQTGRNGPRSVRRIERWTRTAGVGRSGPRSSMSAPRRNARGSVSKPRRRRLRARVARRRARTVGPSAAVSVKRAWLTSDSGRERTSGSSAARGLELGVEPAPIAARQRLQRRDQVQPAAQPRVAGRRAERRTRAQLQLGRVLPRPAAGEERAAARPPHDRLPRHPHERPAREGEPQPEVGVLGEAQALVEPADPSTSSRRATTADRQPTALPTSMRGRGAWSSIRPRG